MAVPGRLMRARCPLCGRGLRFAKIPNRGPVMAHAPGDGEHCRMLVATGRDIQTRERERLEREAAQRERLAARKRSDQP